MNEFLSALLMLKLIGPRIPRPVLIAATVCIEATVPFRAEVALPLESRLRTQAENGRSGIRSEDIPGMLHRAIAFANEDVRDFINDDPGAFLSNTWKLLPETNAALRHRGAYSIREYRIALYSMMKFFRALDPARIFHSYQGRPSADEMAGYEGKVRRNLNHSVQYLRAKLLAVAVMEAAAELSGGDAPVALFMGDIPCEGTERDTLLHHLSPTVDPSWLDPHHPVVRLMRDGRLEDSTFDLRNSPLALWLYGRLKPEVWARLENLAEEYFQGRCSAADFLDGVPKEVRQELMRACAAMAPTRRDRLLSLS